MEGQVSEFAFVHFLIQDATIRRKAVQQKGEYSYDIKPSGMIDRRNNIFQLNMELTVSEPESERFHIEILAVALFSFKEVLNKENLPHFFYECAPPIMFPYIRAYISALTALSGMETINLELMNLSNLPEILKEKTETIEAESETQIQ